MTIHAGPSLCFQGIDAAECVWHVSALLAVDGNANPVLTLPDGSVDGPELLHTVGSLRMLRYDLRVQLIHVERDVAYTVNGTEYLISVPAANAAPRMAYASCNGFSKQDYADPYYLDPASADYKDPYANWKQLLRRHRENQRYHLLIMGGDQVYADQVRGELNRMARDKLWFGHHKFHEAGPEIVAMLDDFYFKLYLFQWMDKPVADAYSHLPALMMWDDHDIIDGWGSMVGGLENTPFYQALFKAANFYFLLFQRHRGPNTAHAKADLTETGHSQGHRIGPCALLAMDLRSERTSAQIMSQASWNGVLHWMDSQQGAAHLFVISSIPVMHPGFNALESVLGKLPGTADLRDDLRDHWTSHLHEGERLRLIKRLLSFADRTATRVTIVSGDVHVGAYGVIESTRFGTRRNQDVINQLTASGIVHPPPNGLVMYGLRHLLELNQDIDTWIVGRMLKIPGTESRFLGARNWLSIEPNAPDEPNPRDVYVRWHMEGAKEPFLKVIEGGDLTQLPQP